MPAQPSHVVLFNAISPANVANILKHAPLAHIEEINAQQYDLMWIRDIVRGVVTGVNLNKFTELATEFLPSKRVSYLNGEQLGKFDFLDTPDASNFLRRINRPRVVVLFSLSKKGGYTGGEVTIGDEKIKLGEGDVIFIGPNIQFHIEPSTGLFELLQTCAF